MRPVPARGGKVYREAAPPPAITAGRALVRVRDSRRGEDAP